MDYKITLGWFSPDGKGPFPGAWKQKTKGTRGYIGPDSSSETIEEWLNDEIPSLYEEIIDPSSQVYKWTLYWYENE